MLVSKVNNGVTSKCSECHKINLMKLFQVMASWRNCKDLDERKHVASVRGWNARPGQFFNKLYEITGSMICVKPKKTDRARNRLLASRRLSDEFKSRLRSFVDNNSIAPAC